MASRSSRATAIGLALAMIAVGAGVGAGVGSASVFAWLLSFAGVLAGGSLIFVGVRVDDDTTAPIGRPAALAAGVRCLRRNLALVGLLLASTAVSATTVGRATDPVLSFCAFALLLMGLSFLNVGVVLGEDNYHSQMIPQHF